MSEFNDTPEPELPTIPTQIAFPLRTILRSVVQNLVGLLLGWVARQGLEVSDVVAQQIVDLVSALVWLVGTALTTWVMTRPAVARLLERTILAPSPAPQRAI